MTSVTILEPWSESRTPTRLCPSTLSATQLRENVRSCQAEGGKPALLINSHVILDLSTCGKNGNNAIYPRVMRFSSDQGLWRIPINFFKVAIDCFLLLHHTQSFLLPSACLLLFLGESMTQLQLSKSSLFI